MLDDFIHRRLHTPYTLHVEELRRPKRPRATIVMIHGIGSSTAMWHKLAKTLPEDVRIVAIDLLGFGHSPSPGWAKYDAATQAKSVIKTLLLCRVPLGSIFVGHSLGGLVAVEIARTIQRYPSQLFLISPPIYKPSRNKRIATQKEDLLRGIYKIMQRYPKNTERALLLSKRYFIRKTGLTAQPHVNVASYLTSLEATIINQSTIDHIGQVKAPITIMSGTRDPLIVSRNLRTLAAANQSMRHVSVPKAGHNVIGVMLDAVKTELNGLLATRGQ